MRSSLLFRAAVVAAKSPSRSSRRRRHRGPETAVPLRCVRGWLGGGSAHERRRISLPTATAQYIQDGGAKTTTFEINVTLLTFELLKKNPGLANVAKFLLNMKKKNLCVKENVR